MREVANGKHDPVDADGNQVAHPAKRYVHVDNDDNVSFSATKLPVVESKPETLSVVRGVDRSIIEFLGFEIIGIDAGGVYEFEEGGQEKYDRVYPRKEITIELEDGETSNYTPPERFGGFM